MRGQDPELGVPVALGLEAEGDGGGDVAESVGVVGERPVERGGGRGNGSVGEAGEREVSYD